MHLDVSKAFYIRQLLARHECVYVCVSFPNCFRYISNFVIEHNIFAAYY